LYYVLTITRRCRSNSKTTEPGHFEVACHPADWVLEANPEDQTVRETVVEGYDQKREQAWSTHGKEPLQIRRRVR